MKQPEMKVGVFHKLLCFMLQNHAPSHDPLKGQSVAGAVQICHTHRHQQACRPWNKKKSLWPPIPPSTFLLLCPLCLSFPSSKSTLEGLTMSPTLFSAQEMQPLKSPSGSHKKTNPGGAPALAGRPAPWSINPVTPHSKHYVFREWTQRLPSPTDSNAQRKRAGDTGDEGLSL